MCGRRLEVECDCEWPTDSDPRCTADRLALSVVDLQEDLARFEILKLSFARHRYLSGARHISDSLQNRREILLKWIAVRNLLYIHSDMRSVWAIEDERGSLLLPVSRYTKEKLFFGTQLACEVALREGVTFPLGLARLRGRQLRLSGSHTCTQENKKEGEQLSHLLTCLSGTADSGPL